MKNKKFIFISLLILAVGFATVSTTLYITGNVAYQTKKSNFDVYFSGAEIDNVDVSNEVIKDKKHIEYTSNELKKIDDASVLKYEVTNDSTEYDATVTISCTPMKTAYFDVTLNPVTFDIDAGEVKTGEIEAKLTSVSEVEQNISIDCELDVKAKERTSIETIFEKNDNYKLSGTLTNSDNENLTRTKLLIKSERQIIRTDKNGYFYVENLERGIHHIYYKEDGDYEISDEELEEYLIAEVSTNGYLKMINKDYKITNFQHGTTLEDETVYCKYPIGTTWDFDYDSRYLAGREFKADEDCTGTYKIELWGASGGYGFGESWPVHTPGRGAYTSGNLHLEENVPLYFYIGTKGGNATSVSTTGTGGYNGGGTGVPSGDGGDAGGGGGGATDVRLISNSNYKEIQSLRSRIMVAAGGGGSSSYNTSTANNDAIEGGALKVTGSLKYWDSSWTPVVNQTQGGAFGYGVNGGNGWYSGGGGGGGYYGGYPNPNENSGAGSGGTSYISGYLGCVAVTSETNTSPRKGLNNNTCTNDTDDITCSYHYSNMIFEEPEMLSGLSSMPKHDGTDNKMTGNTGNGHAKITLISYK